VPAQLARARAATTAVFFITGAVSASWAARIPAIQDRLDLSAGALSVAFLALEGGAVLGLPLGGALVTHIGSRWSLRLGFSIYPPALLASAFAPSLLWLGVAIGVMAAANSVVDVAMNTQGVEIEARHRRAVLSRMHAGHSFGVLGGGLCGTAAAAANVSADAHFAAVAAAAVLAGIGATRWLVDESITPGTPALVRPRGIPAVLCVVAFFVILIDGASTYWSAVHLRTERHASPAGAAAGFTAFALAVALGRLLGDSLVERLGRVRVVQISALVAAVGSAFVITAPSAPIEVVAWAILGAGLATIAPTLFGAAPAISSVPPPLAIATVAAFGYLGSFTGPPLVGAVAEITSLTAAFGLLVAAALSTSLLARRALTPPARERAGQDRLTRSGSRPATDHKEVGSTRCARSSSSSS
jgi:MFS family permease